jgi:CelD/BcsL family acetyltransferase involved in cellulose biosynthesis
METTPPIPSQAAADAASDRSVLAGSRWTEQTLDAVLADPDLVARWRWLLEQHGNANSLFATPEWCEHLAHTSPGQPIRLWCRYDGDTLSGVVPLMMARCALRFDIASRMLWQPSFKAAHVLGGTLHLTDVEQALLELTDNFFRAHPSYEALFFLTTPDDSGTGKALAASAQLRRRYTLYRPDPARPWLLIDLGASFDEYFDKFSAKTRSTLRRLVRKLEKKGDMVWSRIDREDQIAHFTKAGALIEAHSWQGRVIGDRIADDEENRQRFADLARRGILRNYLLELDGEPLAFIIGHQNIDIFYLAELGFDSRCAELSPGTALMLLMLQDLFDHATPRVMNFGIGDAVYKRRFCTTTLSDATWLLLRPGCRRRLLVNIHYSFVWILEAVKKLIGRGIVEEPHNQ